MKNYLVASAVLVATLIAGTAAASPVKNTSDPSGAVKRKTVHISFRNDRHNAVTLQVGGNEITLSPGQTVAEKAKDGDQIVAEAGFEQASGTVLSQVSSSLSGDVIVFHE